MSVKTHGMECSDNVKCRDHVDEKHVYWTCDGPHTWHPGPQSIILHNIKKIRNRVSGNARGEYSSERFECEEDNSKNCILCPSKYHLWHTCKYNTPEKCRKHLRQVGRCNIGGRAWVSVLTSSQMHLSPWGTSQHFNTFR